MKVLGISSYYHDSSAALISNGEVIACAAEERFTRQKHDPNLPRFAIEFCLEEGRISPQDLDAIVFYEDPNIKFTRVLASSLAGYPFSRRGFVKSMKSWLGVKLWIKNEISKRLNVNPENIKFIPHHTSHLAQAFLQSSFKESAILTVDAVGEWAATTLCHGSMENGLNIRNLEILPYPHSLGLVYSAFTAFLGFRVNDGECSTMALASFGEPRFVPEIKKIIQIQDDKTYRIDPSYFNFNQFKETPYSQKFLEIFGEPRCFKDLIKLDCLSERKARSQIDSDELRYADIASSIQSVLEESLLSLCDKLSKITGSKNLCIAGGVGLNCVANKKIIESSAFEKVFIPPDPGDGGAAIGAALYHFYKNNEQNSIPLKGTPFLGKEYDESSDAEMLKFMDPNSWDQYRGKDRSPIAGTKLVVKTYEEFNDVLKIAAEELRSGKVVGWFQGRFENGPRALGNRSILIDPGNISAVKKLSKKVKNRASFRPYALAVTSEDAKKVLEFKGPPPDLAKWMKVTMAVKKEALAMVKTAVHIDGTTRPQICFVEDNRKFHKLLSAFGELSGVSALLNTSFNESGYPIVGSPVDALLTFARTDMDTVVINNLVVRKIY